MRPGELASPRVRQVITRGWFTAPVVAWWILGRKPNGNEATQALRVLKALRAAGIIQSRTTEEGRVEWHEEVHPR